MTCNGDDRRKMEKGIFVQNVHHIGECKSVSEKWNVEEKREEEGNIIYE